MLKSSLVHCNMYYSSLLLDLILLFATIWKGISVDVKSQSEESLTNDQQHQCKNSPATNHQDSCINLTQNEGIDSVTSDLKKTEASSSKIPSQCGVVLAESSLPDAGWGVFVLKDRQRGQPVLGGDVVVQAHDLLQSSSSPAAQASLTTLLHHYWWEASETGGFYEGQTVVSHAPGLGMLANGLAEGNHNVLPFAPRIDEGGLTRLESPGAGAISHYHNYTWFVLQKQLSSGSEVFVNYGDNWFRERKEKHGKDLVSNLQKLVKHQDQKGKRPLDDLLSEGRCLDGLKPGRSKLPHAGRGAFARWSIKTGEIVTAVPVLPIAKESLKVQRSKMATSETFRGWQLLLNYVLGHGQSSIVLVPYGPMTSLINHGPTDRHGTQKNYTANLKWQWSESNTLIPLESRNWLSRGYDSSSSKSTNDLPLANQLQSHRFLLELVATRDIQEGDELLVDYGSAWEKEWIQHVQTWTPPEDADRYAPSYVHDDAIVQARTEKELKEHPYPEHVFTSCFYDVQNATAAEKQHTGANTDAVTTVKWEATRGIFEYNHLRPCRVLERHNAGTTKRYRPNSDNDGTIYIYTVQIMNRYGLKKEERLTEPLIVTHVPRRAIRFTDKIYTTDQHLPKAFRHSIHLPDDIFPDAWKDLDVAMT